MGEEGMSEGTELRILMERVAGDVRLISERQVQQREDIRRIELNNDSNLKDTRDRLNSHATRLGNLEAKENMRKGAIALFTLLGGCIATIIALVGALAGWFSHS